MAKQAHLAVLQKGVDAWNQWRSQHPSTEPDLAGADLAKVTLHHVNFREAKLRGADLRLSAFNAADFTGADLREVNLFRSNLYKTNLHGADLRRALMREVILRKADLSQADLRGSDLVYASLVETGVEGANFSDCHIFGISVWTLRGTPKEQSNLIIHHHPGPRITVDDLEVAQFIYLLLNNKKVRHVIDTITSKVVLILGRFTPKRKIVLDALREELRKRDWVPVLFDFDKPTTRTTLETISTLAHIARYVIADLTDAKSVLQELQAIVPLSPSVIVQPLLLASQEEPGMFDFFRQFPWVLIPFRYKNQKTLLSALEKNVITPADAKARNLAP